MNSTPPRLGLIDRFTKRALDLLVAGVAALVTLPIQAAAALAIALSDGRPVFYRQTRAGRHGVLFEVVKFRTMRVNTVDPNTMGRVTADHELVTRTGRVLRRLKIDELPQLFNVLRGDMSVVGPRPTLPAQVAEYDERQRRRLLVQPGLTGWAQTNGGIAWEWPERILLDIWYVDHWSLRLDMRILARTMAVVVRGEHRNDGALREAQVHAQRCVGGVEGERSISRE